jgi:hypothetical protein
MLRLLKKGLESLITRFQLFIGTKGICPKHGISKTYYDEGYGKTRCAAYEPISNNICSRVI